MKQALEAVDLSVCTVIHFLSNSSVLIGQNLLHVVLSVMPELPFWPLMASSKRALPKVCKTDTEIAFVQLPAVFGGSSNAAECQ